MSSNDSTVSAPVCVLPRNAVILLVQTDDVGGDSGSAVVGCLDSVEVLDVP